MGNEKRLEKLEDSIKWLFQQILVTQKTYAAIEAVSEVTKKTDVLSKYGDYFAYTQNLMIGDVQLQLAKVFVENKDSHSVPKIIEMSNNLFTEDYYTNTGYNQHKTYVELKAELNRIKKELSNFGVPISNLKKIRNRDLAHFDKRISNSNSRENLIKSNPIFVPDVPSLLYFSLNSLSTIRAILFNISFTYREHSYVYELEKIAEAIEKN